MSDGHFIEKCKNCQVIIRQCRCMGPKDVKWSLCSNCKRKQSKGESNE